VPPRAGVLSAVGLLCSPRRRELVRSYPAAADDPSVTAVAAALAGEARALVSADAAVEVAYDCRYVGQSHELTVPSPDVFEAEHERRNGHARAGAPIARVEGFEWHARSMEARIGDNLDAP